METAPKVRTIDRMRILSFMVCLLFVDVAFVKFEKKKEKSSKQSSFVVLLFGGGARYSGEQNVSLWICKVFRDVSRSRHRRRRSKEKARLCFI